MLDVIEQIVKCIAYFMVGYVIGMLLAELLTPAKAQSPVNSRIMLTTQNTAVLRGKIDDASMLQLEQRLSELSDRRGVKTYPIYIVLDSPGGELNAGLAFIEFAKTYRDVKTVSLFAASMASGIVEGLPGERLTTNNGTMMFHRAQGEFSGYFETGEVESQLIFAKSMMINMELVNANRMRMRLADYKAAVQAELWLYGAQIVQYRAADSVVDLECTPALIQTRETARVRTFLSLFGGGDAELTFSGCPLFRAAYGKDSDLYEVPSVSAYNRMVERSRKTH